MKTTATCLILSCAAILSACTGSSSDTTTTTVTGAVLCSLSNSGNQRLIYSNVAPGGTPTSIDETLPFSYAWSCDSSNRTLTSNGVPNHAVTGGEFATKVSAQTVSQSTTLNPATTGSSTSVKIPGYALNGIKFDPATAGTCVDSATSTASCNYAAGGTGTWRMEALPDPSVSPWRFSFGVDTNNLGHVQHNGEYHYHGLPSDLMKARNSQYTSSMTLIGWAADGFPIYAKYGYSNATNATSAIKEMKGSYRVKTTASSGRPATSDFAMGHFQQDWEYVADLGDLDDCNGRTGVTPEFPKGIYHYYLTATYPFVPRCNKGSVSITNSGGGMPPPGGMPPA